MALLTSVIILLIFFTTITMSFGNVRYALFQGGKGQPKKLQWDSKMRWIMREVNQYQPVVVKILTTTTTTIPEVEDFKYAEPDEIVAVLENSQSQQIQSQRSPKMSQLEKWQRFLKSNQSISDYIDTANGKGNSASLSNKILLRFG